MKLTDGDSYAEFLTTWLGIGWIPPASHVQQEEVHTNLVWRARRYPYVFWFKLIMKSSCLELLWGSADSVALRASMMCNAAQDDARHATVL